MKKLFYVLGLALTLSGLAHAAVQAPRDQRGQVLDTINWVGAIPCGIDSSTGTNVVLCGSAGRGAVYGVIVSSVATTDYIVFRDSATANTTSNVVTSVFASGSGSINSGASTTQLIKFPVPIKFTNGISVNANSAPGTTRSRWTILYRPLTATE